MREIDSRYSWTNELAHLDILKSDLIELFDRETVVEELQKLVLSETLLETLGGLGSELRGTEGLPSIASTALCFIAWIRDSENLEREYDRFVDSIDNEAVRVAVGDHRSLENFKG